MALRSIARKVRTTQTLLHFFPGSHQYSQTPYNCKPLLPPSITSQIHTPKPSPSPPKPTFYEPTNFDIKLDPIDQTINGLVHNLRRNNESCVLDESGIEPSEGLVSSLIWVLRNEWQLALLVFQWGERCGVFYNSYGGSDRVWELMIWVLGKNKRFGSAWRIVRKMVKEDVDTHKAMLILIESYATVNNPAKAIKTFQAMNKFKYQDSRTFHTLLHTLCLNGNIEEAEEFMLRHKHLFPLTTESFNIILEGWCNITPEVLEAKRIWRDMSKYGIIPDGTSFALIISCFSKAGSLYDALRFYGGMKRSWSPCIKVYNSLIYVLARENCVKEALNLLNKIKSMGLQLDADSYNAIIPLCNSKNLEKARLLYNDMIREGLIPTVEVYHAFIGEEENVEKIMELMKKMKEIGSGPSGHTLLLALKKFILLKQPENTMKIWMEMKNFGVVPDSAHYAVLVKGMVAFGWVAMARRLHGEIMAKGLLYDPLLDKFLNEAEKDVVKERRKPIKNDAKIPVGEIRYDEEKTRSKFK